MKKIENSPSKFFLGFFRWFCHPRMLDYIEGDLMEVYHRRCKEIGNRKADWKFIIDVLLLFRPGIIKPIKPIQNLNHSGMFRSYFKISWRTLIRNKEYSLINISGLTLSITCCILIFAVVKHHLSYDNFHQNPEQIYRIVTDMQSETASFSSGVPTPLGGILRNNQTVSNKISRIFTEPNVLISVTKGNETQRYKESDGISFVEPEFFDIFNFPLLKGTLPNSSSTQNTAIVTETIAKKYFGDSDPIGESFQVNNELLITIVGIVKDLPTTTDFKSEIFVSYATFNLYMPWLASENFWRGISGNLQCYLVLDSPASIPEVEKVLSYYAKEYPLSSKTESTYRLQPLSDIHFNARYGGVMDKSNLWIISGIGLFLLLTACVNFINMATAKSLNRSKEVGVRKVIGGYKGQLFWQFIFETGIIATLSILIALVLAYVALPSVNNLFSIQISFDLFSDLSLVLFIVILDVSITLLAGCYPAFILGSFQPIAALNGRLSFHQIGGFNTRRTLIISQFVISQIMIISLLVVMNQMRFVKQSDLGFEKEAIVMVKMGSDSIRLKNSLKNEFMRIAGVEKVSLCNTAPASREMWHTDVKLDQKIENFDFLVSMKLVDDEYVSVFDLKVLEGRNLIPSDTVREVLVNEALLQKLGIESPEVALGRTITVNGNMTGPIVGVVKNFHDQSFHEEISPTVFTSGLRYYSSFAIKLNSNVGLESLAQIEDVWKDNYPDQIFEYEFLDDTIAQFYESELTILQGIQVFSFIAIFIGCLGLYGLVSFMVAQKTKEVGIRKVMGGSLSHILWIFGQEFVSLILIAFLIAAPVGWWFMNNWLKDFEFKIDLDIWTFAIAMTCSLLIATLTVGYQVIRAAIMNPAVSLKTE